MHTNSPTELTITTPDDWHVHLRDGAALACTVPHISHYFGRAIIMPNLKPAITTPEMALAYQQRILAHRPEGSCFTPLMTLYLTEHTTAAQVKAAKQSGFIHAFKYYPAHGTTHAEQGIRQLNNVYPALAALQEEQLPLLIHAETADPHIDVFDREAHFLHEELKPMLQQFPQLRTVIEHVTTIEGVDFVKAGNENLAATITAHHLLLNRNDMFIGGLHPHYYCLPVLKRQRHQHALRQAATAGHPKFFLGTDSAPHAIGSKEAACGCAGIYTAHAALELYAEVFEEENALANLEKFASRHGAQFYRLPINTTKVTLRKTPWNVPHSFSFDQTTLIPFRAGQPVAWTVPRCVM